MSELTNDTHHAGDHAIVYFRTVTGTRVHLPESPHLVETDAHPATSAERLQHPVCDWSQAQLGGYGREHFDTIEDAMRQVGVPVEAHDTILSAMRFVGYDEVFAVHSLTYGALGQQGRTVAGFGKSYYWVGDQRVNLPAYVDSARSGHTAPKKHGDICPGPLPGFRQVPVRHDTLRSVAGRHAPGAPRATRAPAATEDCRGSRIVTIKGTQ